jgi:endoglycosylceramidase
MPTAYTDLIARAIDAVRSAEASQGAPHHPIFVEPVVLHPLPGNLPDFDELDDPDLVFSPHVYPTGLTRGQFLELFDANAKAFDMPLWIGEFHFTGRDDTNTAEAKEFAHRLDDVAAGWSWWLWSVGCGDPHATQRPRVPAAEPLVERTDHALMVVECPEGTSRPNEALLPIAGRSYPRATPGRITSLRSDIESGGLEMSAEAAPVGSTLVVWLNGPDARRFRVTDATGLAVIEMQDVAGGTMLRADTSESSYSLHVEP